MKNEVEIVPYTYGLEEEMLEKKHTMIGIEEMSITYFQEADTCSSSDEYQTITLTTKNGCSPTKEDAEKQECFYFDITIPEGQHWSVCEGEELKALVDDFKKRIYLKKDKQ
jgi:hypothetical protein